MNTNDIKSNAPPFTLAIASGKGGTGKTTLATALAEAAGIPVTLRDCDVEEPNAHLFIRPQWHRHTEQTRPVPLIDQQRCTACGACVELCQFNAIAVARGLAMVFTELCHSCGGCRRICPEGAISDKEVPIGTLDCGTQRKNPAAPINFIQGKLAIGQVMAPPLIRATKNVAAEEALNILDCPPGTSCPMITAVRDSDFVLLVTEPTPFGLNDLELAVETVRQLLIPFAVVINRADSGDAGVRTYCHANNINIALEIPWKREIAEAYSRGDSLCDAAPELKAQLHTMLQQIMCREETA
ncbi:MAG: ATP-binding protein [Desulfuromonadaceae bacterium]|nr:ATP-binding protein [Desulfuromonadaceae bacterium]